MKMHKIALVVAGMSFLGLAWAQPPIGVCLQGDGKMIPGQDLRAFTVSLTGAETLGGYFELPTAVTAQFNRFAISAPRKISIVEPNNPSFICAKQLAPGTRSIQVVINYPADYPSYCTITESSSLRNHC